MALAALLIVGDATIPRVLGVDPIEFQLRRARSVGVVHAVIFSERLTSQLVAIANRLRGEGLNVDLARTVADAAEAIHPDEPVLLLTSAIVVEHDRLLAIVTGDEPRLLCVRDEPANGHFERIDATARWVGIGRIDGALLRRTVATIGDWDLGSTLMRRAVQEGAMRITLTPDELGSELTFLGGQFSSRAMGRKLIATSHLPVTRYGSRFIVGPVARKLAQLAGDAGIEAHWVAQAGLALFALSAAGALAGAVVASLFLLVLAQICNAAGLIGIRAGAGSALWEKVRMPVAALAAGIVVLATGVTLALRTAQWGCIVLVFIIAGAMWLDHACAGQGEAEGRWRADIPGLSAIGLVGFALGSPVGALAICAIYATVSMAWGVRRPASGLARL